MTAKPHATVNHGRADPVHTDRPQSRRRQPPDREHFANIEKRTPRIRKTLPLGAQRVGGARISAAHAADVDAPQSTQDQTAKQRTQQVGDQRLQAKFQHARIMTPSASGQVDFRQHAADPAAPNSSMTGISAATTLPCPSRIRRCS